MGWRLHRERDHSDAEVVPDSDDSDEDDDPELCATPPSNADEEQAFRVAKRTLSLALANADGEGHGMSVD